MTEHKDVAPREKSQEEPLVQELSSDELDKVGGGVRSNGGGKGGGEGGGEG
jgi:hypothetical protein